MRFALALGPLARQLLGESQTSREMPQSLSGTACGHKEIPSPASHSLSLCATAWARNHDTTWDVSIGSPMYKSLKIRITRS